MALATTPQQVVALNLNGASTTANITIASAPAGSVLFLKLTGGSIGSQAITYAPSSPNTTWSLISSDLFLTVRSEVWMGVVAGGASGTTVTVTANINFSTYPTFGQIVEWRGAYAKVYHVTSTNATTGAIVTANVTPIASRAAVILAWGRTYSGGSFTGSGTNPANSFTDPNVSGSANDRFAYRYQASTAGSYGTTWTFTNTGNSTRTICVLYELPIPELAFSVQPADIASGAAFSPVVQTEARTDGLTKDTSITGLSTTISIYSGSGTLLGTTTRNFASGAINWTGLGIATGSGPFRIKASATGYVDAISNLFNVGNTITLVMVSQPNGFRQGLFSPAFDVEYRVNGVIDPSFTGPLVVSKNTGPGNLTGSTTSVNVGSGGAGAGRARFSAITATAPGAYIFAITAPTGENVTTRITYVRQLPLASPGSWSPLFDWYESNNGQRVVAKLWTPSLATVGPRPLVIHASDSSNQGSDPDTLISKYGLLDVATDEWYRLAIPISASSALAYSSWRRGTKEITDLMIADGHPIDPDRKGGYGFSGGAQTEITYIYEYPDEWAFYVHIDGAWESPRLTANGIGQPLAAMESIYYDSNYNDTAAAIRFAQVVKNGKTSILAQHSSHTTVLGVRDLQSISYWANEFDNLGGTQFQTPAASATLVTVQPDWKYVRQEHPTLTHNQMEQLVPNSTNWPKVRAWINAQTKTVPVAGGTSALLFYNALMRRN